MVPVRVEVVPEVLVHSNRLDNKNLADHSLASKELALGYHLGRQAEGLVQMAEVVVGLADSIDLGSSFVAVGILGSRIELRRYRMGMEIMDSNYLQSTPSEADSLDHMVRKEILQ